MFRRIFTFVLSILKGVNPLNPDFGFTWADHWRKAKNAKEGFYRVLSLNNGTLYLDDNIQIPNSECVRINKEGKIFDEKDCEIHVYFVCHMPTSTYMFYDRTLVTPATRHTH